MKYWLMLFYEYWREIFNNVKPILYANIGFQCETSISIILTFHLKYLEFNRNISNIILIFSQYWHSIENMNIDISCPLMQHWKILGQNIASIVLLLRNYAFSNSLYSFESPSSVTECNKYIYSIYIYIRSQHQ